MGKVPSERSVRTPTFTPMSPAQAAQRADMSRRTIMRAIEAHELQARRDNRNHWKIDPQDLDRWADAQCAPSEHAHSKTPTLPTLLPSDDALELVAAKAENGQLRERLTDMERDRDHWRGMAEKLAERRRWRWPWQRD